MIMKNKIKTALNLLNDYWLINDKDGAVTRCGNHLEALRDSMSPGGEIKNKIKDILERETCISEHYMYGTYIDGIEPASSAIAGLFAELEGENKRLRGGMQSIIDSRHFVPFGDGEDIDRALYEGAETMFSTIKSEIKELLEAE